MNSMNPRYLAECEREQLHLSGAIQPHGTLLAVDEIGRITHVAGNVDAFLGSPADAWLGGEVPTEIATLALALGLQSGSRRSSMVTLSPDCPATQVQLARGENGHFIVELTAALCAPEDLTFRSYLVPHPPFGAEAMAAAQQEIVDQVAELTGFSRVMHYRFREDGDGEVIAESRRGDVYGSYLGLRYPASDIPHVARQLYLKNPFRLIPNAPAQPVPVRALPGAGRLDLTFADLRSVSPVHQAYLANMGVVASLSFPLVDGRALTGLIAAHHHEARMLPLSVLRECAALVSNHAERAYLFDMQVRSRRRDEFAHHIATMRPLLGSSLADVEANWARLAPLLLAAFAAHSVHLQCHPRLQLSYGNAFEPKAVSALDYWYHKHGGGDGVSFCDSLRTLGIDAGPGVAGALGLDVYSRAGLLRMYLTRGEEVHEVAWGGRPDRPVEYGDGQLVIAPRRSFERWVEKRLGYCRPWQPEARQFALALRVALSQCLHG